MRIPQNILHFNNQFLFVRIALFATLNHRERTLTQALVYICFIGKGGDRSSKKMEQVAFLKPPQ